MLTKNEISKLLIDSMPENELLYVVDSGDKGNIIFNWRNGRYSIDCKNFEVTPIENKSEFAKDCCILIKRLLLYELTS